MRGLHVSLNYPHTNIKKMVCPKNVWMLHCSWTDWESILWGGGVKEGRGSFEKGDRYPHQTMGIDTLKDLFIFLQWQFGKKAVLLYLREF